jgi:hypothetical protein
MYTSRDFTFIDLLFLPLDRLNFNSVGAKGVTAMAKALKYNKTLTTLE